MYDKRRLTIINTQRFRNVMHIVNKVHILKQNYCELFKNATCKYYC